MINTYKELKEIALDARDKEDFISKIYGVDVSSELAKDFYEKYGENGEVGMEKAAQNLYKDLLFYTEGLYKEDE